MQISKNAQLGIIDAERGQSIRGVSNQTAREQAQIFINQETGTNTNDQSWWTWGTESLGGGAGAKEKGVGTVGGTSIGRLAARPGEIATNEENLEIQTKGGLGITSDYLGRTAESSRKYAEDRQDVEVERATQREGVAGAQYQAQSGAVGTWNSQVNTAANVQAQMATTAARESTAMLDEAAKIKLTGAEAGIEKARAAGLQAAEWHRMAQIIGQVTHDMTRRIEEMGQYHF